MNPASRSVGTSALGRVTCGWCLSALVLVGATVAPAEAQGKGGQGSCTDIPLAVTIHGQADPSTGGISGDARDSSGNLDPSRDAIYRDGAPGVYAKFQVCNATYDFYLNLSIPDLKRSPRRFTVDFSTLLVAGDVPGYTGPAPAWLLKVPQMANLSRYSNGELAAMLVGTLEAPGQFALCNDDTVTLDCTGKQLATANAYSDLSVVQVTVAPSCASWTIRPLPVVSSGDNANQTVDGYPVLGLVQSTTTKPVRSVSGGQYRMPFAITLSRTDGGGCNGLP